MVPLDQFLSKTSQSVLLEVLFWAVAYSIYAVIFQLILRSIFSKMKFWNGAIKLQSGVFCANAQDDVVLLLILGVHHLTAGLLCAYGATYNDAEMWRHGYLLEVGFELADVLAMVIHFYPHGYDNVKPEVQAGMVFHHLNGILFSGMIMNAGLHHNEHLRTIAFWLLVGAAFSCYFGAFTHTLNLDTQMTQATLVFYLNTAFFIYCRFYIFPKESYRLIQDVQGDPTLAGSWVETGLYAAGCFLGLFNIGIMTDIIPKAIRYGKRTLDGVTPLDTDDVPLSKEDRMMRRRRSSVLKAVDFFDEATKRRGSSFSTMAGLNSIDDIHKAEVESRERQNISGDDLKALRMTMQKMRKNSSKME